MLRISIDFVKSMFQIHVCGCGYECTCEHQCTRIGKYWANMLFPTWVSVRHAGEQGLGESLKDSAGKAGDVERVQVL